MAITLKEQESTNVLELVVSGKLTHEDYELFQPRVEELVRQHGKLRVLFDMVDFHGWEAGALSDDTKFAFKHFSDISRIAMVGDKTWEKGMSKFCQPFTKAEVRYFDISAIEEARAWLKAPKKGSAGTEANSRLTKMPHLEREQPKFTADNCKMDCHSTAHG